MCVGRRGECLDLRPNTKYQPTNPKPMRFCVCSHEKCECGEYRSGRQGGEGD